MISNDLNVFASTALAGRIFPTAVKVHMIDSVFLWACVDSIL